MTFFQRLLQRRKHGATVHKKSRATLDSDDVPVSGSSSIAPASSSSSSQKRKRLECRKQKASVHKRSMATLDSDVPPPNVPVSDSSSSAPPASSSSSSEKPKIIKWNAVSLCSWSDHCQVKQAGATSSNCTVVKEEGVCTDTPSSSLPRGVAQERKSLSIRKKARIEKEAVQIPEDVTLEILKSLPVKSLLRFRCACKTWYSVISDPGFCCQKRVHLLICRRPKSCSLTCPGEFSSKDDPADLLVPPKFSTVTMEASLLMKEKPLSLPWQPEPELGSTTKFLGSCNGLVCVYHTTSCPDRSGLILWNPSTRKFRKLPPAPRTGHVRSSACTGFGHYTGFGYDEQAGDYKLVWMVINPYRPIREFGVFSLKSKTWSWYGCPSHNIVNSCHVHCDHPGVLSNGVIHWIVGYKEDYPVKDSSRIFAFDLASETKRLLELPQECGLDSKTVSLSLLSGCLCCLHSRYDMAGGSSIDLWMMEEYGVDSSWRKFVSFPIAVPQIRYFSLYRYHPIHFSSEEGNIVAIAEHQDGCEIMRLQVKKGATVSYENLLSLSYFDVTIVFEETLASPN